MAGPNEQQLRQATAGGDPGALRDRADDWRRQARALGRAATTISGAGRGLEEDYQNTADAQAAQASLATFSEAVREHQTRMYSVARGLDKAAETMETAQQAQRNLPGLPDDEPTADITPRQAEASARRLELAEAAREQDAKRAYDQFVTGYAEAAEKMQSAAPPGERPQQFGGSGGPALAPTAAGVGAASAAPRTGAAARTSQDHITGYSRGERTTVDLTGTGRNGTGAQIVPTGSSTDVTASDLPTAGNPSTLTSGGIAAPAGSGAATSDVTPGQAGGGGMGGAAALAGGAAMAKRAVSAGGTSGAAGGRASVPAARAGSAAAKPVTLGQSSRTGSSGVLGKSSAPAARAGSGAPASRASGTPASRASGTPASRASGTPASRASGTPASRASGTPASRASGTSATKGNATSRASGASAAKGASGNPASRASGAAKPAASGTSAARAGGASAGKAGAPTTKAGSTGASSARSGGGAKGGLGRRTKDKAVDVDHLRFDDESAWLDDDDTNPGVVR